MSNQLNYYQFIISFSDIISECKVPKKRKKRTYKEYQKITNNIKTQVNKEDANIEAVNTYIRDLKSSFDDHRKIINECLTNNGLLLLSMNFEYKEEWVVKYNHMHFFVAIHKSCDKGLISIHKRIVKALRKEYQDYLKVRYGIKNPKVKIFEDFDGKKYTYCDDSKKSRRRLSLPSECPNKSRCPYANKCIGAKGFCPNYIEYVDHGKRDIENVLFYLERDKFWEQHCGVDRRIHKKGYSPQYKKYYYVNEAAIREYTPHPIEIPELRENRMQFQTNIFTRRYARIAKVPVKKVKERYTPKDLLAELQPKKYFSDIIQFDRVIGEIGTIEKLEKYAPGSSQNSELVSSILNALKENDTRTLPVISATIKIPYEVREDYKRLRKASFKGGSFDLTLEHSTAIMYNPFVLYEKRSNGSEISCPMFKKSPDRTSDGYIRDAYLTAFDYHIQDLSELKSVVYVHNVPMPARKGDILSHTQYALINLNLEWLPPTAS